MTNKTSSPIGEGVYERSDGQAVLAGPALELFESMDSLIRRWATASGASDYRFPVTLRSEDARRMGFVDSFPHLLTFPVALDEAPDNVRRFAAAQAEDGAFRLTDIRTRPPQHILSHAACSHFYPMFGQSEIDGSMLLTTRSNCFRNETHFISLQRQWCFTMREVVCIGTAADTEGFLDDWRRRVETLLRTLGLPVRLETATDPFFGAADNPKYVMQKVDPVKLEIVYGDELAIGSLNNHRDHFGVRYDIRSSGETAHSACVAFGLERWVYAILDHAGPDPSAWPDLDTLE